MRTPWRATTDVVLILPQKCVERVSLQSLKPHQTLPGIGHMPYTLMNEEESDYTFTLHNRHHNFWNATLYHITSFCKDLIG